MGARARRVGGVSRYAMAAFNQADEPGQEDNRPSKKRKVDVSANFPAGWNKKYDASHLVEHVTDPSQIPEELSKYFWQRNRYFSLYSSPPGCLLDTEGWYSITPERIADQIADRCRCDTILDAFCGVGGNAIAFAKTCQRVIAMDINPTRLALARHNAQIYGVADRIEFILMDYISFAKTYPALWSRDVSTNEARRIDVIFLSPPWGGPSYQQSSPRKGQAAEDEYSLSSIQPIDGAELYKITQRVTQNIAYYLPRNTNLQEVSALVPAEGQAEFVEVEEEWMGSKLKALTCYFGGLVKGQEEMY
ncbi:hypothetical protein EYR36_009197 [Pleurotus pulmonarius]|nr:hypothetical protein EYR36_009197 [Pleurotus pulmonarius]KAF4592693.1 hypothetical protein EYR38_008392 [Pleurotus pulmonarius]